MTDPIAQQFGRSIADDIERRGHWKSGQDQAFIKGACCVLTSNTYFDNYEGDETPNRRAFMTALLTRVNGEPPQDLEFAELEDATAHWNDANSTDEVLATLRSL